MSYKTILLHLNDDRRARHLLAQGVQVARGFEAHLIGLHVSLGDSEVAQTLSSLIGGFAQQSAADEPALARATTVLASLVRREANVLSIIDGFEVAFWAAVVGLLLITLMRAAPAGPLPSGNAR